MSKKRSEDSIRPRDASPGSNVAGADHPAGEPARPGERGGNVRHDRLDTIEWADDRTRALDVHRGGLDDDPIEDLLDAGQTDASYRAQARQATPTVDSEGEDQSGR